MARGTAVLVHGAWSNPGDWRWVADALQDQNVDVLAPGLPSHCEGTTTRGEDVALVEAAIAQAKPPVVVAGWSYGGAVLSDLTAPLGSIAHLVYVASVPRPLAPSPADEPPPVAPDMSSVVFPDADSCVLSFEKEIARHPADFFPPDIIEHLTKHPRRPISLKALTSPPSGEVWRNFPTTVLLGRDDEYVPRPLQRSAERQFADVRIVDGDHFLSFRSPALVASVILEGLA